MDKMVSGGNAGGLSAETIGAITVTPDDTEGFRLILGHEALVEEAARSRSNEVPVGGVYEPRQFAGVLHRRAYGNSVSYRQAVNPAIPTSLRRAYEQAQTPTG